MYTFVRKNTEQSTSYPKLGENPRGEIVLFVKNNTGSIIKSSETARIGRYNDQWDEESFDFSKGLSVTLTND